MQFAHLCCVQVEKLQEQLASINVETPSPPQIEDPPIHRTSFYSHWNGSSLFGGSSTLQPSASPADAPQPPPLGPSESLERAPSHSLPLNGSRTNSFRLSAASAMGMNGAPSVGIHPSHQTSLHEFPAASANSARHQSMGSESGDGLAKILSRMSSMGLGSRSPSPFH